MIFDIHNVSDKYYSLWSFKNAFGHVVHEPSGRLDVNLSLTDIS